VLFLRYLLLLAGWGLLVAAAINVFKDVYQVVQSHRRLRHIAPGSSSAKSSGPEGTPAGPPPIHWRLVESQPNWTAAKRAFPAAWLPLIFAAGIVVVLSKVGGTE